MTSTPTSSPAAPAQREPRQERGQRRVDEILDAAEAVLEELGPAACSIQEIARRAGASVGSIYHFFPTKEAIFQELRTRYIDTTRALSDAIIAQVTDSAHLDLEEFVARLISPFAEFLERSPSFFSVAALLSGPNGHRDELDHDAMRDAMLAALSPRWPDASHEEIQLRVTVMMALGNGISSLFPQVDQPTRRKLVQEMIRAEYGYLSTFEPSRSA